MIQRRTFLKTLSAGALASVIPNWVQAQDESSLIYLSPLQSNGALSSCQAEIWYVQDGADMCLVTAADAWRAQAIQKGLTQTQIWVGDVGPWRSSGGKYKSLPSLQARGQFERDAAEHRRLLNLFGAKYSAEWGSWGPRFTKGLAEGSRVLLRYTPT